jgi:hypothetical protein
MEQTAVEWLEEQYSLVDGYESYLTIKDFIQAKEMEKQEKLECFIEGYKQRAEASNLIFNNASRMYATELFNKTFNK